MEYKPGLVLNTDRGVEKEVPYYGASIYFMEWW
jgi:hypothetical protein